jgi:chloramphenicol-sensitive protein RarD
MSSPGCPAARPGVPGSAAPGAGVGLALLANGLWGVMPLYFKLLDSVPSRELMLHRIVWCAPLLWLGVILGGRAAVVWQTLRSPGTVALLGCTGLSLAASSWAYLHAVTTGQILQSSFGYFLAPLVNVVLGVGFFRERLRPGQWLAVGLAGVGVLNLCRSLEFPWLGLGLSLTFALYAAGRKRVAVHEVTGLLVETTLLLPVAVTLLLVLGSADRSSFGEQAGTTCALVLSGAVTAVPLLAYAGAARRLSLTTLGILQYLSPSCQFLLAVVAYGEPLSGPTLTSFLLVWAAVLTFAPASLWPGRASNPSAHGPEQRGRSGQAESVPESA